MTQTLGFGEHEYNVEGLTTEQIIMLGKSLQEDAKKRQFERYLKDHRYLHKFSTFNRRCEKCGILEKEHDMKQEICPILSTNFKLLIGKYLALIKEMEERRVRMRQLVSQIRSEVIDGSNGPWIVGNHVINYDPDKEKLIVQVATVELG